MTEPKQPHVDGPLERSKRKVSARQKPQLFSLSKNSAESERLRRSKEYVPALDGFHRRPIDQARAVIKRLREQELKYLKQIDLLYNKPVDQIILNNIMNAIASSSDFEMTEMASSELREILESNLNKIISKYALRQKIKAPAEELRQKVSDLQLPLTITDEHKYDAWRKINGRNIVKFLREGWPAPFIEARILTRPALFHLDHSAYKSVDSLRDRNKSLPDDIYLPDRSEVVARSHAQKEKARQVERRAAAERKAQRGLD